MIEFLMSIVVDIWTFIMYNLVSIIAVCVAIIGILFGLKRKGLSYYIESANAVVSIEENVIDKVEVFYEGNKVEKVHLIVMNIRNSGNQSIEEEDFTDHVTFDFGEDANVLRVSVVEPEPPSLYPIFNHTHGMPYLIPLLLNRGDNFIVNFLVSNWNPDALEVRGRIVGVKDIKLEKVVSGVALILFIFAGIVVVPTVLLMNLQIITLTQGTYLLILSYFLLAMGTATSRKGKKLFREYILHIRDKFDL